MDIKWIVIITGTVIGLASGIIWGKEKEKLFNGVVFIIVSLILMVCVIIPPYDDVRFKIVLGIESVIFFLWGFILLKEHKNKNLKITDEHNESDL